MNPKYNYALGAANQSGIPPFDLSKVVMRIFPLRANYHSLQLFCNRFINIAEDYSHVEPAAPYVLFCVINYGHMGNVSSNLGYTSQNEVLFSVPLNWYRRRSKNDSWALQKSSSISPFIWVDQPSSAWTGRDVYGWPKSIAWLKSGLNEWTKDPTAPRTLFSLEALMYRRLFAGEQAEPAVLLEVDREQPSAVLKAPPDPMNAVNPWLAWPKGVLRSLSVGGSLLETMTRLPAFGFPSWGERSNILEMMRSMFGDYNPIRSLPASNTLNLKQFRHPSYPQSISYQAIVNSKMTPKSFSRGGMLGEQGLLRGDLAGGYRIRIHRHPAWPIIESLGLEVSHEYEEQGDSVAVLEPVFPFWVDVDFEYGQGDVICWRTYDSHWQPPPRQKDESESDPDTKDECGVIDPEKKTGDIDPKKKSRKTVEQLAFRCDDCASPHLYNTAEGSAVEQVYGPFTFPNATIRVLPLMADWNKLRKFTDAYLNFPDSEGPDDPHTNIYDEDHLKIFPGPSDPWDPKWGTPKRPFPELSGLPDSPETDSGNLFVPWGRYVYMTVTSYEGVTSELNVGWWARRRVTFSYPVKWFKWVKESDIDNKTKNNHDAGVRGYWELKSFGVISPFMYVDTPTAATVGREMNGWCVAEAEIACPDTDWLVGDGRSKALNLMALSTDVVPALNANQKTEHGLLVEVTTRQPLNTREKEGWEEIAASWGERQALEASAKAKEAWQDPLEEGWSPRNHLTWLKSTAMEVMFRGLPINHIALKQFRDAEDPNKACLQALNIYPESIERIHDLRPIDDPLYVAVHRYPTAPIVDLLGLDVKWIDSSHGQPIEYLQAIRPFWMRADLKAELGRDVKFRAGSAAWQTGDKQPLYFDCEQESATPIRAAILADDEPEKVQDFGSDRSFLESVEKTKLELGQNEDWAHTRGGSLPILRQARISYSPQIAIESILTHRWVNFDLKLHKFEGEASWNTLIPKGSIPNKDARLEFLNDYGCAAHLEPSLSKISKEEQRFRVICGEGGSPDYWSVHPTKKSDVELNVEMANAAHAYWAIYPEKRSTKPKLEEFKRACDGAEGLTLGKVEAAKRYWSVEKRPTALTVEQVKKASREWDTWVDGALAYWSTFPKKRPKEKPTPKDIHAAWGMAKGLTVEMVEKAKAYWSRDPDKNRDEPTTEGSRTAARLMEELIGASVYWTMCPGERPEEPTSTEIQHACEEAKGLTMETVGQARDYWEKSSGKLGDLTKGEVEEALNRVKHEENEEFLVSLLAEISDTEKRNRERFEERRKKAKGAIKESHRVLANLQKEEGQDKDVLVWGRKHAEAQLESLREDATEVNKAAGGEGEERDPTEAAKE